MGEKDISSTEEEQDGSEKKNKRIELSVAQVLGSAVAAVIAAVLAGGLGVYGTFIGAGVMSLVVTSGGPVFQHFFHRTGTQIKEATVQAKTRTPGPAGTPPNPGGLTRRPAGAPPGPSGDATRRPPTADDPAATRLLTPVSGEPGTGGDPWSGSGAPDGEFTAATTHGTRWRGWRRTLLPALLVFVLAIGGITLYEALSGNSVSGGRGTSIGSVFGGSGDSAPDTTPTPTPGESGDQDGSDPREGDETDGTPETGDDTDGSPAPVPTPTGPEAPSGGGDAPSPGRGGPSTQPEEGAVPSGPATPEGDGSVPEDAEGFTGSPDGGLQQRDALPGTG
ncbi:hypothetical protein E0L36_14160 [Streptomyces sp. AJS327]|uniref:hypothetical protein n=1 Tax=Streptomyces sp. AJS327 TaxID=2545265 RepID=UPI0015DF6D12|nr:hypothetical protein [Streptomyces sp. AJS327]MBA0051999.1 hypothetical protein [Streptomyces sp. AJS327]